MIWYTQCIPKHAIVLWMAFQEKLLNQDRIMKWRPKEKLKCALCGKCNDSHGHLFFQCSFSAEIWEELQLMMNWKSPQYWKDIANDFAKMKHHNNIWSIVRRFVHGAAVYYVWQERNRRVFGNEKRTAKELYKEIVETVKMNL
ncbi:RNA-directed DNA polymerase, eukaryota, reverse transcriptase zinc-binding domain protein, partial [Tanacetum coccineum]